MFSTHCGPRMPMHFFLDLRVCAIADELEIFLRRQQQFVLNSDSRKSKYH